MPEFSSFALAISGWEDKPLAALPPALQERIKRDAYPLDWDALDARQRRSLAEQLDYQDDPALAADREFWWQFFVTMDEKRHRIEEWERSIPGTAEGLARKQDELTKLRAELAWMKARAKGAPAGSALEPSRRATSASGDRYIPFPKALHRLAGRLQATADEVAAWVFMEPEYGGLRAYVNANELNPPPRFYYDHQGHDLNFDYLAPLMGCWFDAEEISAFAPKDRFITGRELIDRWSQRPGIRAEAFILAKIEESRLYDLHPVYGGTRGADVHDDSMPPLEAGLFCVGDVEKIEATDFDDHAAGVHRAESAPKPSLGSREWLSERARAAANAKHARPGGSRDKQEQIRAIWATGKYESRERCAEEECGALGMSFKAARKALIGTANPPTRTCK